MIIRFVKEGTPDAPDQSYPERVPFTGRFFPLSNGADGFDLHTTWEGNDIILVTKGSLDAIEAVCNDMVVAAATGSIPEYDFVAQYETMKKKKEA